MSEPPRTPTNEGALAVAMPATPTTVALAVAPAVSACGWVFIGCDDHPAVVLNIRTDSGRLFVVTGTSNANLARSLGGAPVIVREAEGRALGWPGTTHFYPQSTSTVSSLSRDSKQLCPPILFMRLRKLVGF